MLSQIKNKKSWTILIYANGNNDLEREMYQGMLDAEKVGSNKDVNVVIQLGRIKFEIVKLIRQETKLQRGNNWSGVRRYFIWQGNSTLVGNLRNANMANPKTLYDFIKWAIQFYPAKKYMLILGGHGYQFVGMMTDYSRKAPYIMGYPEMVIAINKATNEMGSKIDLLLLDTCYFNTIETIYELGRDKNHSVQNVVTYIANGDINGLPHDQIINIVQQNSEVDDSASFIKILIDNLSYNLVAYKINYHNLENIKQMFNKVAYEYVSKKMDCKNELAEKAYKESIHEISEKFSSLIIYYKKNLQNKLPLIMVANKPTDKIYILSRYYRLGFAQNNYWFNLLNGTSTNIKISNLDQAKHLLPLKLNLSEVGTYLLIMNPKLKELQKKEILKKLYNYQKWILR